jgi:hypothetical protein
VEHDNDEVGEVGEQESVEEEDDSIHYRAPRAVYRGAGSTENSRPFPLLRCALSGDGSMLVCAGGDGEADSKSFLGTPVWVYDITASRAHK